MRQQVAMLQKQMLDAQESLGDLTFVEPPLVGKSVTRGDECGVVESVKAASDIFAPVSGEIAEVNTALEGEPELINQDPYGNGWIYKMKGIDTAQLDDLLSASDYEASL